MAVVIVGVGTNTNLNNPSPGVIFDAGDYSNVVEDDLMVMWVRTSTTAAISETLGWTSVLGSNVVVSSGGHTCVCVSRWVTAAEDSANTLDYIATNLLTANKAWRAATLVFRGVDPADPFDAVSSVVNTTTTTTHVLPGVSSGDIDFDDCMVGSGVTGRQSSGTYCTPAGWTSQQAGVAYGVYNRVERTTADVAVASQDITISTSTSSAAVTVVLNPSDLIGADEVGGFFFSL